ncbi:hypothetical protein TIFTF001_015919 [Ficus carica]|uniref:FLZ-type domain-containing protein n=1 Tax=Ficus carica TaxID=3494 RepID=A0AA88A258_FICCA|nr:hypothetical protein TIFTF001_015919 [Ficus carica]
MSSRQPSKITRSSSQRDQLGPQNVALNQRRLALLRYVLSLLPPKNPSAAIKHPSNNGKDIVKNAAASSPIDHDHIGERRRHESGHDHDQEQPRSRRCTFELASSSREVDCWISKKTKKKDRADEGIGAFLQRCALCNKFIDGHIYMYG